MGWFLTSFKRVLRSVISLLYIESLHVTTQNMLSVHLNVSQALVVPHTLYLPQLSYTKLHSQQIPRQILISVWTCWDNDMNTSSWLKSQIIGGLQKKEKKDASLFFQFWELRSFTRKRLEEDICWIIHCWIIHYSPPPNRISQGNKLNWTELTPFYILFCKWRRGEVGKDWGGRWPTVRENKTNLTF